MTPDELFKNECTEEIATQSKDLQLAESTCEWMNKANTCKYSYHFEWLGRPIIQYPQDIMAMQELIWTIQPDLIIETGIARGGSLIFYAAMLELNAACGGPKNAKVVGIDIDIREHNRAAIESHPMFSRIQMIEGSSVSPDVIGDVKEVAKNYACVMVILDSNHTHDHVLQELEAFAPLTTIGSYIVVFDTIIEDFSEGTFPDRPWGPGNNPKTAVWEYLKEHPEFEIDRSIQNKLLITVAPDGFLKRVL